MKKVIFIFFMLLIPFNVSALNITPIIECDKTTLYKGDLATCKLKLDVKDGKINAIEAKYNYDDEYSYVTITNEKKWQGKTSSNKLYYYSEENHDGIVTFATLKYIIKQDINITDNTPANFSIRILEVGDEQSNSIKFSSDCNTVFSLINKKNVVSQTVQAKPFYNIVTTTKSIDNDIKPTISTEIKSTTKIKDQIKIDKEEDNRFDFWFILLIIIMIILILMIIYIITKKNNKYTS